MMNRPASKYALIQDVIMDPENVLTVTELCAMNGVSRSGYYSWCAQAESRAQREARDRADFELILQAFRKARGHAGARQIQMILLHQSPSIRFNIKKIRRLMRKFNLECPIRKANPYRRMAKALRTDNVSENLVRREFEEHGPRTILLTDITYIPYQGKFAYLSTILDACTKQVLAYRVSDNLKVDFVLETVKQLVENHGDELETDVIVHSDQGCHYTSVGFRELLRQKKLRQSMSRRGNCWDNAPQESFFGHMKDEIRDDLKKCRTFQEICSLLDEQIRYYNEERYQWDLAKLSPDEFYKYVTTGRYPLSE